jgi:hypothetical protein
MSRWMMLLALLAWAALPGAARGAPGLALVALQPAPSSGEFAVGSWLGDPGGWPARALDHPDGWSVAYTAMAPPPGWMRPFVMRGGGPAAGGGALHPRYACALAEMSARRAAALLCLRAATDPEACYPGQPNPMPLARDGWLFAHDGSIAIEPLTSLVWLSDADPDWVAFREDNPRDFNGNGDPEKGNAGEIYFLALLHELQRSPDDVPRAFRRTLARLSIMPDWDEWQYNAILQRPGATWVLRWVASDPQEYPLYYGLTDTGEYCISDTIPELVEAWIEIPNHTLACFTPDAAPEWITFELSDVPVDDPDGPPGPPDPAPAAPSRLMLRPERSPCVGALQLAYGLPPGEEGSLEVLDLQGRRLAVFTLIEPHGQVEWTLPQDAASGILFARLRAGDRSVTTRISMVR